MLWWVAGLGGAVVAGLRGRGSRRGQVFVAVVVGGGCRRGPCRAVQVFVAGLRGQVFVVGRACLRGQVFVAVVLWYWQVL